MLVSQSDQSESSSIIPYRPTFPSNVAPFHVSPLFLMALTYSSVILAQPTICLRATSVEVGPNKSLFTKAGNSSFVLWSASQAMRAAKPAVLGLRYRFSNPAAYIMAQECITWLSPSAILDSCALFNMRRRRLALRSEQIVLPSWCVTAVKFTSVQ